MDARLSDAQEGGTKTYIRSLAEVLASQTSVVIRRAWLVLPFSNWWKPLLQPGDMVLVNWDVPRLLSAALRKYLPESLFAKIKAAYFSTNNELKRNNLTTKIEKIDFDIAHLAIQDGVVTNLPFVYHPHDLQHLHFPEYFDEATIAHRENHWRTLATNSAKIICASQFVREDLKASWEIDDLKIEVLPMPTPNPIVMMPEQALVSQYSIICIANFWPHKNQETLIRATQILLKQFPAVTVTFVGDGPMRQFCQDLADELGLSKNINFLGTLSQSELEERVSRTNVVCVPSEFEAASFPIIEGMKFGKQIVASDIGPFFEIADTGIEIYGQPRDLISLAISLRKALDAQVPSAATRRAYEKYLSSISPEAIGNKIVNIYRSILEAKRPE